ncbi:MAG TPA: metallopeptidase family protein [Thermaerobacter sp.]
MNRRPPGGPRRRRRLRRYRFVPVDFDTFAAWADRIVRRLPPRLLEGLEGGVQIDPQARRNPQDPPGVYLLGEYITEPYLGRFIRIYYGSFERVLVDEPAEVWFDELEETILHELQHHVEALAGVDWLGLEDLRQLQQLWEDARRGARAGGGGPTAGDDGDGDGEGDGSGDGGAHGGGAGSQPAGHRD